MRNNKGFSLVELLTVIAIIAILAAVIFPVMTQVRKRADENNCLTNLHQIGQAVAMFKQDNRRFPAILGSEVITTSGARYGGSGEPDLFENAKDKYLFPEYVKASIKVFHCPASRVNNSKDVAMVYKQPGGDPDQEVYVYAYDSYDAYCMGAGAPQGTHTLYSENSGSAEMHYRVCWAPSINDVANVGGMVLDPYPPNEVTDSARVQQQDYERQLRWRNPPGDTLITWCSYHETREGSDPRRWSGRAQAVFLDGHTESFPANEMERCKWRIRSKK